MDKRLFILFGCAALAACGESTDDNVYGAVEVRTLAPNINAGFATTDGWSVKFDRFLVNLSSISIGAGDTGVVTTSAPTQLLNAVTPPPNEPLSLLSDSVRYARNWDAFTFQIGPAAAADPTTDPPPSPEAILMGKGGYSIYVEARASKGAFTKTLKWGFTTDTTYSDCEAKVGGETVKGVLIPIDGVDVVDLFLRGDVLFSDTLVTGAGAPRFERLAAADANLDGEVTLDELAATTLETARGKDTALYEVADRKDIVDLGGFVTAQARKILGAYRTTGTCKDAPTPTTP